MKSNLVSENNFLFLRLEEVICNLIERTSRSAERDYLMIALSEEVIPVATQIAKSSGINTVLSFYGRIKETRPTNEVQFEYEMVKRSGRGLPQDVIFHEERNLKAKMISWYKDIYKQVSSVHPGRAIILVDSLTSDGFELRQRQGSAKENKIAQTGLDTREISNVARQFIYLHLIQEDGDGLNMIIEQRRGDLQT